MVSTDFQFKVQAKEKRKANVRAYIGNLRASPDIKTKLVYLLHEKGFDDILENDVEVHNQKSCFVFVSCRNVDRLIAKLNGLSFDGRKLLAQREQKNTGSAKSSFGGGWAGPNKSKPAPTTPTSPQNVSTNLGIASTSVDQSDMDHQDAVTLDNFRSRCQMPLTDLLSEFGEFDPNFKKVVPTPPPVEIEGVDQSNSQLGKVGKAPLHVDFCSFGYIFSAPSSRSFSHAHPLPPLDCRHLPTVPPYLVHKPGISFAVKRVILTDDLKTMASNLIDQVFDALVDAIGDGHGYVMPLRMTIPVGSANGRHRSVLLCEEAAKGLRDRLRKNVNDVISVSVSVGTMHPDMDRRRDHGRPKAGVDDDEW